MVATLLYVSISPGFLYRMSMIRAQSSSLAMLFILFALLHNKKYWWASLITACYVWLYYAFPLLLILLGCFALDHLVFERKIPWKLALAVLGGLVFALIANPYFPYNITTLHYHLFDKFLHSGYSVKVGNEWYPFSDYNFVVHLGPALILTIFAIWTIAKKHSLDKDHNFALLLFTFALMLMSLKSRRFVELFPPFAVFLFIWVQNGLKETSIKKNSDKIKEFFLGSFPKILTLLIILPLTFNSFRIASTQIKKAPLQNKYQSSAEWLSNNSPKHSMVVASDWDEFTRLFYHNTHNVYLTGLDPYLLFAKDRDTFLAWKSLTQGELKGSISWFMKYKFKSKYLFVSRTHLKMAKLLEADPNIELAFDGGDSWIFKVK
jgi:hypothetical protein